MAIQKTVSKRFRSVVLQNFTYFFPWVGIGKTSAIGMRDSSPHEQMANGFAPRLQS